jgi:hypothetical protein
MRRSLARRLRPYRFAPPLALLLLAPPVHAQSLVREVTVVGVTANTEVLTGDACGTGQSGPNACNDETIEVAWTIWEDAAPADSDPSPTHGVYAAGSASLFLVAAVTINGQAFPLLAGATTNRNQTVELWDELNMSGTTDRILLALSGDEGPPESFVSSNLLLGQAIDGDGLDALAGPFAGPPVVGGTSTFALENPAGRVIGQYGVTDVAIGAPEPGPGAQLAAAALALGCVAGRRGSLRR